MDQVNWSDTQAIVLRGLKDFKQSLHAPLRIDDARAVKNWLSDNRDRICSVTDLSTPDDPSRCPPKKDCSWLIQIAFTYDGLQLLGVPHEALQTFSDPFIEGMAPTPAVGRKISRRAGILGDVAQNDRSNWNWGGSAKTKPHALLILYAKECHSMIKLKDEVITQRSGWREMLKATSETYYFEREHFGFIDGISQPIIEGTRMAQGLDPDDVRMHRVAPGEFVLGYPNERGVKRNVPSVADDSQGAKSLPIEHGRGWFGCNGSYLVARQLAQNVEEFDKMVQSISEFSSSAKDAAARRQDAAERLVGRHLDGSPLSPGKPINRENGFGFADNDSDGLFCPVASHARRSNPRDSLDANADLALKRSKHHRLLRRGRSYGPPLPENAGKFQRSDDGLDRGLFFVALAADIAGQFEFVQDAWSNNPSFGGLAGVPDPILGTTASVLSLPGRPGPTVGTRNQVVTVRGGGYFFLPGLRAIDFLIRVETGT